VFDTVQTSRLKMAQNAGCSAACHVESSLASAGANMNHDCKPGLRLRLHFEHTLKEWGWFDAYEKALELMPVGLPQVHEFQQEARHAHAELAKARHAYVEHMAQ